MASEIAGADDLPVAIREQLCEFTSDVQPGCMSDGLDLPKGEDGFPEIPDVVKSNCELHVALEALPSLPGSRVPAKTSMSANHSTSGSNWSIHASKSSRFQASAPRLKFPTFSSDIAPEYVAKVLLPMQSRSPRVPLGFSSL